MVVKPPRNMSKTTRNVGELVAVITSCIIYGRIIDDLRIM